MYIYVCIYIAIVAVRAVVAAAVVVVVVSESGLTHSCSKWPKVA